MKKIAIILLVICFVNLSNAQNNLKAKKEYEEAEKAYETSDFDKALVFLSNAENDLGVWSGKIAYLKIMCLDNMSLYSSADNVYTKKQQKEVAQYLKLALNKTNDNYKVVTTVDKKLNFLKKIENEKLSEDMKMAEKLYKEKNYKEYAVWLLKAANKGNSFAMKKLASSYESNLPDITEDLKLALEWYRKAFDNGCKDAAYSIGLFYKLGMSLPSRDMGQALNWFKVASDWNTNANTQLGDACEEGKGQPKDCKQALVWYKKAAYQGKKEAFDQVGDLYKNDCVDDLKSYTDAMIWYKKAIENGNSKSYNSIASMYEYGNGVEKNDQIAIEWYKKGAELDDFSKFRLGELYYKLQNYDESVEWLTKYYDKNTLFDKYDLFNLCELHYYGGFDKRIFTTKQNTEKCILYLIRASKAGNKDAMSLLSSIYTKGENGFKDYKDKEKGKEWLLKLQQTE
jgi:TPR repeat protein